MELTSEQQAIINSTGDIRINAVAGSGKTTTIIEYARARPRNSKILYLAFNRSVKLEAIKKFEEKGLANVKVETAHSLAYKHIIFGSNYKVRAQGYKSHEIAEMLGLQGNGERHAEYIVANHINKFIAYFCNSDKQRVQDLNYLDVVSDSKAKVFVTSFYGYIEKQTRLLLSEMDRAEIEITHDFYLKKFQLANPSLSYDYILFDEGQDASPAMPDVFLKQKATKVIVGDTHQQIYGWRFAVNSLEKAEFKSFDLSTSFRFGQDIADLAVETLKLKRYLGDDCKFSIKGKGVTIGAESKAIIGRTNLGLLLKAIEYVTQEKDVRGIYFEGNINSYTYAEEGASLYDVLNLYNGNRRLIKDKLIRQMRNLEDLEEYIEKTEEAQLSMMVEIVKQYGNEIPKIIKSIKEKHIENDDKGKAEIIFSTVHRCKGMEYDSIQIIDDFITEEKLEKSKVGGQEGGLNKAKLAEEINLLYVAITRSKNSIQIPGTLLSADFPSSSHIQVMNAPVETKSKEKGETQPSARETSSDGGIHRKSYTVDEVRNQHKDAYMPWSPELDDELTAMYCEGVSIKTMADHFGRTSGAIRSRIKKLELYELYG